MNFAKRKQRRDARKRYILFHAKHAIDGPYKRGIIDIIQEAYPRFERRRIVWVDDGVIVRTEAKFVEEVRRLLELRTRASGGNDGLESVRTSGSISKLKRLASRHQSVSRW